MVGCAIAPPFSPSLFSYILLYFPSISFFQVILRSIVWYQYISSPSLLVARWTWQIKSPYLYVLLMVHMDCLWYYVYVKLILWKYIKIFINVLLLFWSCSSYSVKYIIGSTYIPLYAQLIIIFMSSHK